MSRDAPPFLFPLAISLFSAEHLHTTRKKSPNVIRIKKSSGYINNRVPEAILFRPGRFLGWTSDRQFAARLINFVADMETLGYVRLRLAFKLGRMRLSEVVHRKYFCVRCKANMIAVWKNLNQIESKCFISYVRTKASESCLASNFPRTPSTLHPICDYLWINKLAILPMQVHRS